MAVEPLAAVFTRTASRKWAGHAMNHSLVLLTILFSVGGARAAAVEPIALGPFQPAMDVDDSSHIIATTTPAGWTIQMPPHPGGGFIVLDQETISGPGYRIYRPLRFGANGRVVGREDGWLEGEFVGSAGLVWSALGFREASVAGDPFYNTFAYAAAQNSSRRVAGGSNYASLECSSIQNFFNCGQRAAYWEVDAYLVPLVLPVPSQGQSKSADMNEAGDIVGWLGDPIPGAPFLDPDEEIPNPRAAVWRDEAGYVRIDLETGLDSKALAIGPAGDVAGLIEDDAVVWRRVGAGYSLQTLPRVDGSTACGATDIEGPLVAGNCDTPAGRRG